MNIHQQVWMSNNAFHDFVPNTKVNARVGGNYL